mgnify:CR=1 FL=1
MWREAFENDKIFLAIVAAGAAVVALSNTIMLPVYLSAVAPEIYGAVRRLLDEM